MTQPNPADLAQMADDEDINLLEKEGLNVGYLAFNTEKEPYTDKRVRQALNLAINKEAIIEAVFQGAGKVAKNPIPPTIWSYNENTVDYPYDPEQAKTLLTDAGFGDGFETDLWAMPVTRPYNPDARRMAEMIQADWAKIGVKANIVSYEWGEYLKRSKDGEHQTVLLGWTGDNGDPDNFLAVLLGCDAVGSANRARWCHQPFEDLIQQAKIVSDKAERTRLYEEAQLIFKEEAPWVTIAHSVVFQPVRQNVVDFLIDPFGGNIFIGVDLTE
jgi:dipeptide transport system substrate-binding protein